MSRMPCVRRSWDADRQETPTAFHYPAIRQLKEAGDPLADTVDTVPIDLTRPKQRDRDVDLGRASLAHIPCGKRVHPAGGHRIASEEIAWQSAQPLQRLQPAEAGEAGPQPLEAAEIVAKSDGAARKARPHHIKPYAPPAIADDDIFVPCALPPDRRCHRQSQKIERIRTVVAGRGRSHR